MPISDIEQEKLVLFQRYASLSVFDEALVRPINLKSAMGKIVNQYRALHSAKQKVDVDFTHEDAYLEVRQRLLDKKEKQRITDNKKQERETKKAAVVAAAKRPPPPQAPPPQGPPPQGPPPQGPQPLAEEVELLQKENEELRRQMAELLHQQRSPRKQNTAISAIDTTKMQVSDEVKEVSAPRPQLSALQGTPMPDAPWQVTDIAPLDALVIRKNTVKESVLDPYAIDISPHSDQNPIPTHHRRDADSEVREPSTRAAEPEQTTINDPAVESIRDDVQGQHSPAEIKTEERTPPAQSLPPAVAVWKHSQVDLWRGLEDEEEYKAAAETYLRLLKIVYTQGPPRRADGADQTNAYKALTKTDWKLKEWVHSYGAAKIIDDRIAQQHDGGRGQLEVDSHASLVQKFITLDTKTQAICLATSICDDDRFQIILNQLEVGRELLGKTLQRGALLPSVLVLREQSRSLSAAGVQRVLDKVAYRIVLAAEEDQEQRASAQDRTQHVSVLSVIVEHAMPDLPVTVAENKEQIVEMEEKQSVVNHQAHQATNQVADGGEQKEEEVGKDQDSIRGDHSVTGNHSSSGDQDVSNGHGGSRWP